METMQSISRRFVEWVIVLWHKYQDDLFFRTTVYVVALQTALVIVSIVIFSAALHYTDQQVINATISRTASFIVNYPTQSGQSLSSSIDAIQNQTVRFVFAGVIAITVAFGVVLAYVTLRPAHDSLEYQKLFISNIAHELRTPLSTVKTETEVALLDKTLTPSVHKVFTSMLEELDRMSEIINNLLSLNQFLRPERMEFGNVDLGPIIEGVVRRLLLLANQYTIELQVKKNDYSLVWGNAAALEQVITNLIKNALSYTPKGHHGVVTVSVQPDYQGSVVLTIADNGIGISQKDLFHIFEPFYRADTSRVRRVRRDGSGLGLAIVNEIVRAHRGKIQIRSAIGKGTTVSVILPAGTTPAGEGLYPAIEKEPLNEVSVDFSKRI